MFDLIEKKDDGTTVVYIAFWRYFIYALLFAVAFYVLLWTLITLYDERPPDFWQHWGQTHNLILGTLIGVLITPFFSYWVLKDFYKKIQLEIGRSHLRYLRGGVRGGVLLSENYCNVSYQAVTGINISRQFLVNRVINVQTGTETHKIILLLSESEKMECYDAIQRAVEAAKNGRP